MNFNWLRIDSIDHECEHSLKILPLLLLLVLPNYEFRDGVNAILSLIGNGDLSALCTITTRTHTHTQLTKKSVDPLQCVFHASIGGICFKSIRLGRRHLNGIFFLSIITPYHLKQYEYTGFASKSKCNCKIVN